MLRDFVAILVLQDCVGTQARLGCVETLEPQALRELRALLVLKVFKGILVLRELQA